MRNARFGPKIDGSVVSVSTSAGYLAGWVLQTPTGNFKKSYTFEKKLGKGQFGTTFVCVEKATGKRYACKSIKTSTINSDVDAEDVRREIEIMQHLAGSPNVISIKGAYEDAVAVYVVMELCEGGELFDGILRHGGNYTERKVAKLIGSIVEVVELFHSSGVMHRDLKPENFLFVNQEEDALVKIIDFGLSVFFKPGEKFSDEVGSPCYVAPEVLDKCYGPEADIWSAGVILCILLTGVPPFWAVSEEELCEKILRGDLDFSLDPWPSISDGAKDLVRKMLVRDPTKRILAPEVLCHPWVQVDGVALDSPLDSAVLSRLKQFSEIYELKKLATRIIAESSSEENLAGLREKFEKMDTHKRGHISYDELKAGLQRLGHNLNESEIYYLMQAGDVQNRGTINYEEFLGATLHMKEVHSEESMFGAFMYFDKDGSGYITKDNLREASKEFGLEGVALEKMIQEVDQDGDGCIDYNEFVGMMLKRNVVDQTPKNLFE